VVTWGAVVVVAWAQADRTIAATNNIEIKVYSELFLNIITLLNHFQIG
jgi:hypothetical protein